MSDSDNQRLAALATEYGLRGFAEALQQTTKVFVSAPPVLTMRTPLERAWDVRLAALIRRGLNDSDLDLAATGFDAAPLEGGLLAWSVLKNRLSRVDDAGAQARLAKLRGKAAPVTALIPNRSECWLERNEAQMTALLEQLAIPPFEALANEQLVDGLSDGYRLGAIELLRRRVGRDILAEENVFSRCREFAWLLALARLTSLSWFYLQYLWRICRYPAALSELCDLVLDERAFDLLPTAAEWDELSSPTFLEVRAYVEGRALLAGGKLDDAMARLAALPAASRGSYALLLEAELELRQGPLRRPIDELADLAARRPLWKHCQRLFVVAKLRAAPDDPAALHQYDLFEATFGLDLRTLGMCQIGAPPAVRAALEARLIRDLLQMPFDPSGWTDLATRLSGTPRLWQELRAVRAAT